jgi:hypothetical protein
MSLEQILKDADVKKPVAMDVAVAIDCSQSMHNEFSEGIVAKILTNIQTFAKFVDDDGQLETVGFNTESTPVNTLTLNDNIPDFIATHYRAGGSTHYAGAISNLLKAVDHNLPSIIFVITDGENYDKNETRQVLQQAANDHPTKYIHFVRAGTDALNIKFIEEVANELSNVGYSDLPNVRADDETFFKSLITDELAAFLNSQAA